MASFFPLGPYVVVGLSIAEFITGILKAVKPFSKYGKMCLVVFGTGELVLGLLLAASIITQVTTFNYWYSKALYSMAVGSDFVFLWFIGGSRLDMEPERLTRQTNRMESQKYQRSSRECFCFYFLFLCSDCSIDSVIWPSRFLIFRHLSLRVVRLCNLLFIVHNVWFLSIFNKWWGS